jgi:hypothetical protein
MKKAESKFFSASYDSTAKVISVVVILLLAAVVFSTRSILAGGCAAVVLLAAYAYSPRGYLILDGAIVVRRGFGNVRISLDGIRELRKAHADDLTGCIRLFGSGGLFGWYGLFRTSKLGKCTWYVTNRANVVVLITDVRTILFSPDDVEPFIALIPGPQAGSSPFRESAAGGGFGQLFGGAVAVVAISFAAFAWLYAPGPPSYTLTPQALTIHDRFYPVTVYASTVDVDHVRVVDVGVDSDWRPTLRTNGFANAHYHSGWFRVASGKTIRLYRAYGERLVLLPPAGKGDAVLLETKDPDKFVRELRQEWTGRS